MKNSLVLQITDHVERILDRYLKRNKMIGKMWPGLQIASVDENTIVVVNVSESKSHNVKQRENFLYCEHDRSTGCIHTAFVWMQAEDLELDRKL
jgi:hypothetical protein